MQVKTMAKIFVLLAVLLLIASYPACQYGEHLVLPELAKLSPAERELHELDLEYIRFVLPGILMFFAGVGLVVVATVIWIVELFTGRRR